MNKLNQLQEAIIELVPEIRELKFGCRVLDTQYGRNHIHKFISQTTSFTYLLVAEKEYQEWTHIFEKHYEILGRDITLCDAIIAIRSKHNEFSDKEEFSISVLMYGASRWNLEKNALHLQDEPTINFLHDVICVKHTK